MSADNSDGPKYQFVKLGGSLITDKTRPHSLRPQVLSRLAEEIAYAWENGHKGKILFGHGSGSFGHVPAKRYNTRQGVRSSQEWRGFIEVWNEAAALNHLVISALQDAGLPAISFPPSACVLSEEGRPVLWNLEPIRAALKADLLPVVFGDVVFDRTRGGTILSTEDLFVHLARFLHPARFLLAGREEGVWEDFPACTRLIDEITPDSWDAVRKGLKGSMATDVTGGMLTKVQESLSLLEDIPKLQVLIFSGEISGHLSCALMGEQLGTCIHKGS